jgi:hypothetical protein
MPNHCCSIMTVTGPLKDRNAFKAFARAKGPAWDGEENQEISDLQLNQFVPIPHAVLNAKTKEHSDAYNSGGYEWVKSHWGTKWGVYDIQVEENKARLRYEYRSAWAPFNEDVLQKMSEMFPSLRFEIEYGECGSSFCGTMVAEGGEVTYEEGDVSHPSADQEYCLNHSG